MRAVRIPSELRSGNDPEFREEFDYMLRPMSVVVHSTPLAKQKASDICEVSLVGKIPTETYENQHLLSTITWRGGPTFHVLHG